MTSEFDALVARRAPAIHHFLQWADNCEASGWSMRWDARADIRDAGEATYLFTEPWWGVVVFTCFGSLKGARAVKDDFQQPIDADEAWRRLDGIDLAPGSIGHHRIQPAHKGARRALVSACEHAETFRRILHTEDSFDDRYSALIALRAPQWGRTTSFDLLLRAGSLGIGGHRYAPERAYLAGSTGPAAGFKAVWGRQVTWQNADQCEGLLRWWSDNWDGVCEQVGADWHGAPYIPADFENALCIYQEQNKWAVDADLIAIDKSVSHRDSSVSRC